MTNLSTGFSRTALTAFILLSFLFFSCGRPASKIDSVEEQLVDTRTELNNAQNLNANLTDTLKDLRANEKRIAKMVKVLAVKIVKSGNIITEYRTKSSSLEIIFFGTDDKKYIFKMFSSAYEQYPGVFRRKDIINLNEQSQKFALDSKRIEQNIDNILLEVQNNEVINVFIAEKMY